MIPSQTDMAVHHALVRHLITEGRAPASAPLALAVGLSHAELEDSLRRLAQNHSLVLHPHTPDPWIVHPFSLSPTHTWVDRGDLGWWAPCLWCGLGVATLVGGDVVIHTRIGGEAEPIEIAVRDGCPKGTELWAHFPEPPRLAWNNVHHFCARLLPFHRQEDVAVWAERHGLPLGQVLPVTQLAALAQRWYGRHAQPDWRKVTVAEAAAIFTDVGLTGDFWRLESRAEAF